MGAGDRGQGSPAAAEGQGRVVGQGQLPAAVVDQPVVMAAIPIISTIEHRFEYRRSL